MSSYKFFADRSIEKYRKSDVSFLICVILLWGLGLFTLYFVSQNAASRLFNDSMYFVKRQFICSIVGFLGFAFFAALKMPVIKKLLPLIVIGTIIGFIIPPLTAFTKKIHQGYDLYNVGFAAGLLGTVFASINDRTAKPKKL